MAFKNYSPESREKKQSSINYEVIERFGVLDSDSDAPKELRLISWNGNNPKYDLRGWYKDEDGNERMTKGITLDFEELSSLYEILKSMDSDEGTEDEIDNV